MNLYIYNTIINTIWYIFTIVFVLYRFTSFFTYTYNFLLFCGKIWNGAVWTKNKISNYVYQRQGYNRIYDDDVSGDGEEALLYDNNKTDIERPPHQSFLKSIKDIFNKADSTNSSTFIELHKLSENKKETPHSTLEPVTEFDGYESYVPSLPSFSHLHQSHSPYRNQSVYEDNRIFQNTRQNDRPFDGTSSSMLLNSKFINQALDAKYTNTNRDTNQMWNNWNSSNGTPDEDFTLQSLV